MSIWDDPDIKAATSSGEYKKWETVGDNVVGKILAISPKGGSNFDGDPCPLVVIEGDDGEEVKITLAQANLVRTVAAARPEVGDRVAIVFTDVEKLDGGRTLKKFTCEVKRATEVAAAKPASLL
jgi:hypothetical protein